MNLGFYVQKYNGRNCVMHRTLVKCLCNPVLRFVQFWTDYPWVITSKIDLESGLPKFVGYHIARVRCLAPFDINMAQKYEHCNAKQFLDSTRS